MAEGLAESGICGSNVGADKYDNLSLSVLLQSCRSGAMTGLLASVILLSELSYRLPRSNQTWELPLVGNRVDQVAVVVVGSGHGLSLQCYDR